jgi:hypothetical protein
MDLETLITVVFCVQDDCLYPLTREHKVRQHGPAPSLVDSEVWTMEVVGELLGAAATARPAWTNFAPPVMVCGTGGLQTRLHAYCPAEQIPRTSPRSTV